MRKNKLKSVDVHGIVKAANSLREQFNRPVRVVINSSNLGPHLAFWIGKANLEEGQIVVVYPKRAVVNSDVDLSSWVANNMPTLNAKQITFTSARHEP